MQEPIVIAPTRYFILCECRGEQTELTQQGEVITYVTRQAARADAAYMRQLMEGGARVRYRVVAAR